MAWQRKIPFGYRMERGEIVPHPEEAEAVAFIYGLYRQGESYLRIAGAMSELGVRYHEATCEWNKHMIKRMLENPKYAGQEPFPAIVPAEVWREAQAVRDRKTTGWKSQSPCVELLKRGMVCGECGAAFSRHTPTNASGNRWWHCSNPECSCTLKMRDDTLEEAVTALLNRLVTEPELLDPREPGERPLSLEAARMQNEINRELGKTEINEEYLTALIFSCAAEKYEMLDSGEAQRKTARLKAELRERPLLTAFDASLFSETTEALLVSADGSLALRLYSGGDITETGKEREPYASDSH